MAASKCFIATLPNTLSDEQFEKLHAWSQNNCVRSDFVRDRTDGCIRLLVTRRDPRTQRDYQRLLRTTLLNYGVGLPAKQIGWLRTFDECEYDNMKAIAGGGAVPEGEAEDNSDGSRSSVFNSPRELNARADGSRSAETSSPSDSPSPPQTHPQMLLRAPVAILRAR